MNIVYCSRCEKTKPASEFGQNNHRKNKLQNWCRQCRSLYRRSEDGKMNQAAANANHRAKGKRITDRITTKEIEALKTSFPECAACGSKEALQLDHVVAISNPNSSGSITNFQILCKSCNRKKGQSLIDYHPIRRFIARVIQHTKGEIYIDPDAFIRGSRGSEE